MYYSGGPGLYKALPQTWRVARLAAGLGGGNMRRMVCVLVLMSCMSLAIMPAGAADYTLDIFGNANMDDMIDEDDIAYVEGIIDGTNEETELADANYDGEIDEDDITQIELIIRGEEKEITILDSAENAVTVKKPLNRIVVTWRGMLETLRLIEVDKDRIVGVESLILSSGGGAHGVNYQIFFPEYQDKADIGVVWTPDCEAILNLHPDAVFLFALPRLDDASDKLESAGVTVIRIYGGALGMGIPDEVEKLGYIFGKRTEAEEFIDWHASIMDPIKERVEAILEEDKPKVYFEYGTGKYNTGTESNARIHWAGGNNIFPDVQGGMIPVDPEAVVAQNPDIIIKGCGCGGGCGSYELDADDTSQLEDMRDEILNRPELQMVTAVREGRVYVISGYLLYGGPHAGCRGFLQTAYTAKWFHPELFEDRDPQAIHQEYLTEFQGLDYDLDEQGVFVYPEPS